MAASASMTDMSGTAGSVPGGGVAQDAGEF